MAERCLATDEVTGGEEQALIDPDTQEMIALAFAEVGSFGGSSILNRGKRQKRSLTMTNRL